MDDHGNVDTAGVTRPNAFLGRISSEVRSLAAQVCRRSDGERILDVGCGNGLLFAEIGNNGCTLFGLDSDLEQMRVGRQILHDNQVESAMFALGDASHLPYKDNVFDKVLLLNTLMNIQSDEFVKAFIAELIRITLPGGKILVDIRNNANWILRTRYWLHNRKSDFNVRGFALRHLRGLFEAHNCEISTLHSIGPWLPFGPSGILIEAERRVD